MEAMAPASGNVSGYLQSCIQGDKPPNPKKRPTEQKGALPGLAENNTSWAIAGESSRAEATSGHRQRDGTPYREGLSLHLSWEDSGQVRGMPGPPPTLHTPPRIAGQATLTSATRQGQSPALLRTPGEYRLSQQQRHGPHTSHLLSGFVMLREQGRGGHGMTHPSCGAQSTFPLGSL